MHTAESGEPPAESEVASALRRSRAGDRVALDRVMAVVYGELRRIAGAYLARERRAHTLRPTELVDEAYLRLVKAHDLPADDHRHFVGIAAHAMRRVLREHARARAADKRGGGARAVTVATDAAIAPERDLALLDLLDALDALEALDPREARLVELHVFGGLSLEEIGRLEGVSKRTAIEDWNHARAWLAQRLKAR
jgi:RNA polymerase sigma factor (TIGR02999 family)